MTEQVRAPLSRQVMVEHALQLLNEVGLDGLTVRRLAAALGVKSPSLYWHLRTKQELLDAMADAIVQAAGMGPPHEDEPWQHWLARRALAYRRSLLAHRDGARVVANATQLSPATLWHLDQELAALVARGFTPVLALRTITAVTQYVNGFVLQEQAERSAPDLRRALAEDRQAQPPASAQRDDGLGTTLLAAIRQGGSPLTEQAFQHGIDTLIGGTVAALTRQQPNTHRDRPAASRPTTG